MLVNAERTTYAGGMVERYRTTVENGTVVVRDVKIPDGTPVTVELVSLDEYPYVLTAEDVARLDAAEAEIDRGEGITGAEFIANVRNGICQSTQPHSAATDRKRQRLAKTTPTGSSRQRRGRSR
ncbi:MAG: hypothetical protein M3619_22840 [Myxococcota bacterium]|nr:hypothetical protein [Myxococcota bacterium]